MRPVLVGLTVAASLAISLIGVFGFGSVPSVAACGGPMQEECDYDSDGGSYCNTSIHPEDEAQAEARRQTDKQIADANKWADTYLAAEKAAAVYWHAPLAPIIDDCDGSRIGTLIRVDGSEEPIQYGCDSNYGFSLTGGCVPNGSGFNCDTLRSWGIANIVVSKDFEPWPGSAAGRKLMVLDEDHIGVACRLLVAGSGSADAAG